MKRTTTADWRTRPRKPPAEKQTCGLTIRMTEAEFARLEENTQALGKKTGVEIGISAYIKGRCCR